MPKTPSAIIIIVIIILKKIDIIHGGNTSSKTMQQTHPLLLSPALPTELLRHILDTYAYPSTLVVCASRPNFLASLASDLLIKNHHDPDDDATDPQPVDDLLAPRLFQLAVARHIRIVFTPTLSHLRAFLSVFCPEDSPVGPPPNLYPPGHNHGGQSGPPALMVYGLLHLHRGGSEWSVQSVTSTASLLLEAAYRHDFRVVLVEPKVPGGVTGLDEVLSEEMPLLGGGGDRVAVPPRVESIVRGEGEDGSSTVDVRQAMRRWFEFQKGKWEVDGVGQREEKNNDCD